MRGYDETFRPLFSFGAHVSLAASGWDGEAPQLGSVREDLERLVAAAAARRPADGGDFDQAWFAVCAWLDEKLSGVFASVPGERPELMQRRYFNTLNAGEEFFDRLARLLDDEVPGLEEPARREILKVYAYCLDLGFRGKFFRAGDRPVLEALRLRCIEAAQQPGDGAAAGRQLFQAFDSEAGREPSRTGMFIFWAVPVAVTALLYAVFRFLLSDLYLFLTG